MLVFCSLLAQAAANIPSTGTLLDFYGGTVEASKFCFNDSAFDLGVDPNSGEKRWLVPRDRATQARFFAHSGSPNCQAQFVEVDGEHVLAYYTIKSSISLGDPLTIE
jgi:hypothetical protein